MRNVKNKEKQNASTLRKGTRIIWLLVNCAFILCYFVAMLSPYLSPRVSQIPAFLNLGFFLLLFLLIILWIYHLITRNWKYLVLYSVIILLSSGYILNYFPLHLGKKLTAERDLRIMTYNVMCMGEREKSSGERLAARFILEKGADIVALQEAYLFQKGMTNKEALVSLFGNQYPFIHSIKGKGQVILSKYEILYHDNIDYESLGNGSQAYILQLPNDKTMLLVNNHMESYMIREDELNKYKGYIKDFKIKQLPQQILEVKRRLGPKLNQRAYAAEVVKKEIINLVKSYEPDIVVVLGDLNDTPMSYTYQQMRGVYRDAFAETGFGISPSFNEPLMPFRIDHLFYDGPIRAVGSSLPTKKDYSDHNPLIVDFKWKKID